MKKRDGSKLDRRSLLVGAAGMAATLTVPRVGRAQAAAPKASGKTVRIGFLSDLSSVFSVAGGMGSLDAVRMAIADFGGQALGRPVELLEADHQNKPDIGLAIAREWYEDKNVDMIMDISNSSIVLAVQDLAKEKKKILINVSSGTSDFTGKDCSPYGVAWVFDSYASAAGVATSMLKRGGKTWFFITVDYNFGQAIQRDMTAIIEANGGTVLGSVRHPLNTADMSSFLLQAQNSGAKVIGLCNGAADARNCIKQAHEFGIIGKQSVAGTYLVLTDIHALGLETAQGVVLVEAFYWDLNDKTRAFSQRYFKRNKAMPTMFQAGNYSAAFNYLKAVQKAGTNDADAVMAVLKSEKINDFMTENGYIRADGRMIRDMYLFQVKAPSESKGDWDCYNLVRRIPGEEAARPLSEGGCPYIKT